MAESNSNQSPFVYGDNNPISNIDFMGLDATDVVQKAWDDADDDGQAHHYNGNGEKTGTSEVEGGGNGGCDDPPCNNGIGLKFPTSLLSSTNSGGSQMKPLDGIGLKAPLQSLTSKVENTLSDVNLLSGFASNSLVSMAALGYQTNFTDLKSYPLYKKNGALYGTSKVSGKYFMKVKSVAGKVSTRISVAALIYDFGKAYSTGNPDYIKRGVLSFGTSFIPYGGFALSAAISSTPIMDYQTNTSDGVTTCFVAGTKVKMADGSEKNIEAIEMGDLILSVDTSNFRIEVDEVLELPTVLKKYRKIKMVIAGETIVEFSPAHPFWVEGKGWAVFDKDEALIELEFEVSQLQTGDNVLLLLGDKLVKREILDLNDTGELVEMYNVENVKKNHSFFANGILVHNKRIN